MMIGVILLVVVAYYLFNSSNSDASCCMKQQYNTHSAQAILGERYARGQIDREDYLERKQELSGQKQLISIKKG